MPIRVLAVDDEADIRRVINIKLSRAGFDVLTASDGEEGLNLALTEKPDVMIVDVMMPKKNGYELIAEVREKLGAEAPVSILLTAKGEEADVIKGFSEGADDYIKKPFSPAELIDRVNINLAKRSKISS